MNPRARVLWGSARLLVWPRPYDMISVPADRLALATALIPEDAGFAVLLRERDEISLTLPSGSYDREALAPLAPRIEGPFRVVTLDVSTDFDITGFLSPAAERLAEAGVPIVPQCGFLKDHIVVKESDLDTTVSILEELIATCRRASSDT